MSEYHYVESGLRNIWLTSGFEVIETKYGTGVAVHDVVGLHAAIGKVISRQAKITGAELRFLRKEMDMSQRALGQLIGVTDQAVAKWEKTGKIPKTADRMIRLVYMEHVSGNIPIRSTIERLNDTDHADHIRMTAEESEGGWRVAA